MESRISLITLGVKDLKKSIKFYKKGLGLKRYPFKSDDVAFFNLKGTWLGLYPWEELAKDALVPVSGKGFRGVTLAHNVKTKAEVRKILAQAKRAGAAEPQPGTPRQQFFA